MANSSGNSLLTGIYAGLTNTYSYLAAQNPNGVTLDSITKAQGDTKTYPYLNTTFASYLQSNFTNIDKNNDGIITSDEMNNLTNQMSTQGLTKEELTQLYASGASGLSTDTMNNILEHFDDMDTNHDGRITSAEISAYNVNCSRLEKEDEFNNKYEQFLEGQKTFAPSIFKKRQEELQLLIESNLKFKTEAQRQIAQAEKEVFAPVHQQLGDAVRKVGKQKQLKAIFNTDNNAVPYLSEDLGIDVTNMIKEVLLKP